MPTATFSSRKIWSDEALEALPGDGCKYELLKQLHIYRPDSIEAFTRPTDVLDGGDVVPDLSAAGPGSFALYELC